VGKTSKALRFVVVFPTYTSGNADMAWQMSRQDEEFPMALTVDESRVSISPSWYFTAILIIGTHH